MNKVKFQLEYLFKPVSRKILWNTISTANGLELWLADEVVNKENVFTFKWGKEESRDAVILSMKPLSYIRFHWCDDENDKTYMEMRISKNEMTNERILEITDFAEPEELDGMKYLWDSQIETLKRQGGM